MANNHSVPPEWDQMEFPELRCSNTNASTRPWPVIMTVVPRRFQRRLIPKSTFLQISGQAFVEWVIFGPLVELSRGLNPRDIKVGYCFITCLGFKSDLYDIRVSLECYFRLPGHPNGCHRLPFFSQGGQVGDPCGLIWCHFSPLVTQMGAKDSPFSANGAT